MDMDRQLAMSATLLQLGLASFAKVLVPNDRKPGKLGDSS